LFVQAFHCFTEFFCAIHFFGLVWFNVVRSSSDLFFTWDRLA
jgi:hypothetical protein